MQQKCGNDGLDFSKSDINNKFYTNSIETQKQVDENKVNNTDKLYSQNFLSTFMNAAVTAASMVNNNNTTNNNNNYGLNTFNPASNPGLIYLSQLISSDLNGASAQILNSLKTNQTQTQQNSYLLPTSTNTDALTNQKNVLQSSNFLEPFLQCSSYFQYSCSK